MWLLRFKCLPNTFLNHLQSSPYHINYFKWKKIQLFFHFVSVCFLIIVWLQALSGVTVAMLIDLLPSFFHQEYVKCVKLDTSLRHNCLDMHPWDPSDGTGLKSIRLSHFATIPTWCIAARNACLAICYNWCIWVMWVLVCCYAVIFLMIHGMTFLKTWGKGGIVALELAESWVFWVSFAGLVPVKNKSSM